MAVRFLLDTNAVLYFLQGRLIQPLPKGRYLFSVITEIELLSYPDIAPAEEAVIRYLLSSIERVELDLSAREKTIAIRRAYRLKLPDAAIAASTLLHDAVLLINDSGFDRVAKFGRQSLLVSHQSA